jgi:hypothetical protein
VVKKFPLPIRRKFYIVEGERLVPLTYTETPMSKFLAIFTAAVTGALFSSLPSHAALVSCGTSSSSTMCSLCDVFVTGNTIVNYFSGILLPLALVTLTVGGILYLMNRVDQAKSIITASVLGIILSLSAFLIVNLTMRAMNVPQTDWNTFTCTAQVAATPPKTDGTTFNTTGDGGPKDTVGNPGDITGDPTVTPESVVCNEGRNTTSITKTFPLALTLSCTNTDKIVSAIWHFPSDSNFGSQTLDSRQNLRANNTDTITFQSASNPDQWNEITVDVTEMNGVTKTYTYGFGGATVVVDEEEPENSSCTGDHLLYDWGAIDRFVFTDTSTRDANGNRHLVGDRNTAVFRMVVTANMTTAGRTNLPYMYVVEEPSFSETGKEAVISRSPCNFQNPKFSIFKASDHQQGGFFYIRINDSTQRFTSSGYRQDTINLTTGVWYFTVRNFDTSQSPDTKYNLRAAFIY